MEREISAHLVRLRRSHPFFAALSMFARYEFSPSVKHCETDGLKVFISPQYFKQLDAKQRTGLLLHVTLHAALLHPVRRGAREARAWNVAADIVVNNLLLESGTFDPPANTAVEPAYKELSVEQVYERLMALPRQHKGMLRAAGSDKKPGDSKAEDLSGELLQQDSGQKQSQPSKMSPESAQADNSSNQQTPQKGASTKTGRPSSMQSKIADAVALRYPSLPDLRESNADGRALQAQETRAANHWRAAFRKAQAAARLAGKQQGDIPASMTREIEQVLNSRLDWRSRLWRYMVRTPSDFSGFDRRFIHQGLYLDALQSDSLTIYLAVDTSGSIEDEELAQFMGEVRGVKRAYSFIDIALYFIDADLAGPYTVEDSLDLPVPTGGGGTDFEPFFHEVAERAGPFDQALIVYLTDGYGSFPDEPPVQETLWVVAEGGADHFPFGEVARLSDCYANP